MTIHRLINVAPKPFQTERTKAQPARLGLAHYLFLLFWVLKPFYLGESGTMQMSDGVFMLSFFAWLWSRRHGFEIARKELFFIAFVGATLLINGIYAATVGGQDFLMSTLYYVFNLFIILVINDFKNNRRFLKALLFASVINLLVQLFILLTGGGRSFWGDYRFMGTFNDPNQFAFSVFSSFLIIYLLVNYFNDRKPTRGSWIVVAGSFLLAFYFVVQGSSTGMLMGVGVFALMMVFAIAYSANRPGLVMLRILAAGLLLAAIAFFLSLELVLPTLDENTDTQTFLLYRLVAKVYKVDEGGFQALLLERGIDKLFDFPHYLIYGAGEGGYFRFPLSTFEVHSTLPGILFYYGILPFLLLVKWIRENLRGISLMLMPVYLALLVESFTLAHQRQPAFFIIIVLGSLVYQQTKPRPIRLTRRI